jgi:hypothetical protein
MKNARQKTIGEWSFSFMASSIIWRRSTRSQLSEMPGSAVQSAESHNLKTGFLGMWDLASGL